MSNYNKQRSVDVCEHRHEEKSNIIKGLHLIQKMYSIKKEVHGDVGSPCKINHIHKTELGNLYNLQEKVKSHEGAIKDIKTR